MGSVLAPDEQSFPVWLGGTWDRAAVLRYGENPHQSAALYRSANVGLAHAEQLGGKEMSYNNYVDADAALRAAFDFDGPAVAVVKHANPCGIAVGADVAEAHAKAHACDPVSAYGGVIAANRPVTAAMAQQVAEVFTEVLVAPDFDADALQLLSGKKNLRRPAAAAGLADPLLELRAISGGALLQTRDLIDAPGDDPAAWTLVSGDPADDDDPGRPAVRLARGAQRAVQRDPARQGRRRGRHRHGPGQPGRLVPAGRRPGRRRAGHGVGRRVRRVLPVRRRARGAARRRGAWRSCSPVAPSATRRSRRRRGRPASRCTSPAPATSRTDPHPVSPPGDPRCPLCPS